MVAATMTFPQTSVGVGAEEKEIEIEKAGGWYLIVNGQTRRARGQPQTLGWFVVTKLFCRGYGPCFRRDKCGCAGVRAFRSGASDVGF